MSEDSIQSFTGCVVGWDWMRPTHVLVDSRITKRATAIGMVAREYGSDFQDARCKTTYARWLTRQEIWDDGAGECWWAPRSDGCKNGYPPEPADGWEPNPERDAMFTFCGKNTPGAVKVYEIETGL